MSGRDIQFLFHGGSVSVIAKIRERVAQTSHFGRDIQFLFHGGKAFLFRRIHPFMVDVDKAPFKIIRMAVLMLLFVIRTLLR